MDNNIKITETETDLDTNLDISVDFEELDNIALEDVRKISDIHRIAVLNGKKLYIKNAAPEIMNILAITGLNKSFTNFDDQYKIPAKRQRSF